MRDLKDKKPLSTVTCLDVIMFISLFIVVFMAVYVFFIEVTNNINLM